MSAALHPAQISSHNLAPAGTVDSMARAAGVSRRLVFLVMKAHRGGCEEVRQAIVDGTLTGSLAAVLVELFPNHDDQRTMLAEFATLPRREWLGFARRVAALVAAEKTPKPCPLNTPEVGAVSIPPNQGAFATRLPSRTDGTCYAGAQP
jgi:hypothetical protein